MRWPHRGAAQREEDPAASMALLVEVLDRPVDPGYWTATQQRRDAGLPAQTSRRSPLLIITVVLLGFLLSVSALSLRAPDPQNASERRELAERIETAGERGDASAARVEALREDISALEARGSNGADPALASALDRAGEQAGADAVQGPGLTIALDDAPSTDLSDEPDSASAADRVLAGDLQRLVNGLWWSGAEAISINEQRLTSTSSIRFAGEAIVVDFRGLTRPYTVRAIGDPDALAAELDDGDTGEYFADLGAEYGIVMTWERGSTVRAPAAERLSTRVATVEGEEEDP